MDTPQDGKTLNQRDFSEFIYKNEDFISNPDLSKTCSMNQDIVQFIYSFGYDSLRRNNLCVVDEHTVVYLSGNYIHVLNVKTGEMKFVRSTSGVGLGHIAKHPTELILAVGERGYSPLVILYSYPDFNISRILKDGTEKSYNYVCFSPKGDWLITQGGEPDHTLTIWNWKEEKCVLKEKAGRETWKTETNPFVGGEIIASGVNHITFWMMTETFTGLKLKRHPGKFGSRPFCHIYTFCALPKGKVMSPNQNNNIYVWRGEEITLEIKRNGGLSLHNGEIVYLEFNASDNEIFSVGMDGTYKVWDYTRINRAPNKVDCLELQPSYQKTFSDNWGVACPVSFQRTGAVSNPRTYYMQDRSGSIWLVEMAVKTNMQQSKRVLMAHEGPIGDIAASPADYLLASVGAEGKLHIYSIRTNKLILCKTFNVGGTALLWLPLSVSPTGCVLIAGFSDGSIRTIVLLITGELHKKQLDTEENITVIQVFKPHSKTVTAISLCPHCLKRPMVLTSSIDKKIFIHWLIPFGKYINLEPYAFVEMLGAVNSITWSTNMCAVLVTIENGSVAEIRISEGIPKPPPNTYRTHLPTRISYFSSVKSSILREETIKRNIERRKKRQERRKRIEHKKQIKCSPMISYKKMNQSRNEVQFEQTSKTATKITNLFLQELKKNWNQTKGLLQICKKEEEREEQLDVSLNPSTLSVFLKNMKQEIQKEFDNLQNGISDTSSSSSNTSSAGESETEANSEDNSEDELIPSLFIPSKSPYLFFARYSGDDRFWVSVDSYDCGYCYEYILGENKPCKSTPLPIGDIEMSCFVELCSGKYYGIGLGNGGIQIVRKNVKDNLDFSDYWMSITHDNIKGRIRKICTSYDEKYLYSMGCDANVFSYSLNLPESSPIIPKNLPEQDSALSVMRCDDTYGPDTLSLEDALALAEKEERKKLGKFRKLTLVEHLTRLALKFQTLLDLNQSIPESHRLPNNFFVIDEKFEEENNKLIKTKRSNATNNSEYEYWKEKFKRDKIYNYFIRPVRVFKIYLFGVDYSDRITSFYQPKITKSFIQAEKEADSLIVDILKRGSEKVLKPLKLEKESNPRRHFKRSKLEVHPLIKRENEIVELLDRESKTLYIRLSKRRERRKILNNILKLFLEEKEWKKKQFLKNIEFRREEKNDMRYILKSDPNYKLSNLRKITTEKKFYQLVTTKRKIYDLTSRFNYLVLKLREKKSKISAIYAAALKDLSSVVSEFGEVDIPEAPRKINLVEPLEFPELYYMDFPPEFPHKRNVIYSHRDNLYCQLYEINKQFPISSDDFDNSDVLLRMKSDMNSAFKEKTNIQEPWEQEFTKERKDYLLSEYYKKGQIIKDMVVEYDEELRKLVSLKMDYEIKIAYLKLFYQKYYEELQIIRSHQIIETQISKKLEVFTLQKHVYILRVNIQTKKIKKCLDEITLCSKKIDKISNAFVSLINNISSQHKRHLKHIFKKKWRPEKVKLDDNEESSSSEEEEEEEEEEDEEEEEQQQQELYIEDLLAMDHRPVDERTKPAGLDEYVFNETFNLRDLRQAEERKMFEKKTEIQHINEQIDETRKTLLAIETFIAFYSVKLSCVLREKHKELSNVRTVVILNDSQMQHFDVEKNEFPSVKDSVLFPLYNLKNLDTRKRQLKDDILNVQLKKQETVKHVKRLDLDISYLRSILRSLKEKINIENQNKFGLPVNLEKLEEAILLKIVKELKYNTLPFHLKFHTDIVKLQREFDKVSISTTEHIKKNTYEELKYGALLEQKRMYEECLSKLKTTNPNESITQEDLSKNINELLAVVKMQEDRIECLENEINRLKYKSYVPQPEEKKQIVRLKEIKELLDEDYPVDEWLEESDLESADENVESELEVLSKMSDFTFGKPGRTGAQFEEHEHIYHDVSSEEISSKIIKDIGETDTFGECDEVIHEEERNIFEGEYAKGFILGEAESKEELDYIYDEKLENIYEGTELNQEYKEENYLDDEEDIHAEAKEEMHLEEDSSRLVINTSEEYVQKENPDDSNLENEASIGDNKTDLFEEDENTLVKEKETLFEESRKKIEE